LAVNKPTEGSSLSGMLVIKDFNHQILDARDVTTYTNLSLSAVSQNLIIPFHESFESLKRMLSEMFEQIDETTQSGRLALKV